MRKLYIESTDKTPRVTLDPSQDKFEIIGKSIPKNAEEFYYPILNWFNEYVSKISSPLNVTLNFEFFNIASSKRILYLLYQLNELIDNGKKVVVNWYYNENDDDMFELGQDYAFMVRVPFKFIEKSMEEIHSPVFKTA